MSVNIETTALSTSESLDSLKTTPEIMHPLFRVWVDLTNTEQWYSIIREANQLYGTHNWRGQPRVKRKLEHNWGRVAIRVWFDVPDPNFASWIAVKHSIIAKIGATK